MKFKVLEDFKTAYGSFEEGNSHDSEKLGATEEDMNRWHGAGWIEISGKATPARSTAPAKVQPKKAAHQTKAKE